jgi:hypothetical protein
MAFRTEADLLAAAESQEAEEGDHPWNSGGSCQSEMPALVR